VLRIREPFRRSALSVTGEGDGLVLLAQQLDQQAHQNENDGNQGFEFEGFEFGDGASVLLGAGFGTGLAGREKMLDRQSTIRQKLRPPIHAIHD